MVTLYPNRNGECFFSSLANLLSFRFRDKELAERILEEWWKHEIVLSNGGTLHFSWPYLVSALTDQKYQGILYADLSGIQNSYSQAERFFPTHAKFYREIVTESIQAEKIVPAQKLYDGRFPVILSLTRPEKVTGHAVVLFIDRTVINDGKIEDYFDQAYEYEINAVLRINPS